MCVSKCAFVPCVHMEVRAGDGGGEERAGYLLKCPKASRVATTFLLLIFLSHPII